MGFGFYLTFFEAPRLFSSRTKPESGLLHVTVEISLFLPYAPQEWVFGFYLPFTGAHVSPTQSLGVAYLFQVVPYEAWDERIPLPYKAWEWLTCFQRHLRYRHRVCFSFPRRPAGAGRLES